MKGSSFTLSLFSGFAPCYYYVIIDHDYLNRIKLCTSFGTYQHKLNGGPHYIDVVKANECNDAIMHLVDLEINGQLLDYDYLYKGRVRVYGDSTVAGFGILSHDDEPSTSVSDSVRDFVYHALYDLNMDMDIFSASGYGLAFSIYTYPNDIGIINYVNKVGVHKTNRWIDKNPFDLLIVSLGTNDYSYINADPNLKYERIKEFKEKYRKLIAREVRKNPNIKVLVIYGSLKEKDIYPLIESTYDYLKKYFKNLNIHRFDGDNSAISNHAYVTAHDQMTEELKQVIKSIM